MIVTVVPEEQPDQMGVPVSDRGLAYGDGLFETILVVNGQPQLLEAHRQRMLQGAERLAIPLTPAELCDALASICDRLSSAQGRQVLKLILTRGSGGRGYKPPEEAGPRLIVSLSPAPAPLSLDGVAAVTSTIPLTVNPVLAGIKTLNRLEQVMASRDIPADCFEALMAGTEGDLREGTRTALLYRWQDQWWTPPRDKVAVHSVMLGHVERGLAQRGEGLKEAMLFPDQLWQPEFSGLLLLNSVIGAVPVQTLDGRRLPQSGQLATIVSLAKQPEELC